MRITCLIENTLYPEAAGCGCEHGLSLYIETCGRKILFDMGQTEQFAENAAVLGVDLSAVDTAVLSHGHYDHGGGLKRFLAVNDRAPVYLSRYAFEPHYNGTEKYIGLDTSLADHPRLRFTDGVCGIGEGMTLYSCNERERPHNPGSFGLTMLENGVPVPDDFRHEQYLLIEENGRRILFSGCSHKGIADIVRWFTPDVLIGGFHFSKITSEELLEAYARDLDSFDTRYYTCHCTGEAPFRQMKRYMKHLYSLSAGQRMEV